jgi:hypothetical protein
MIRYCNVDSASETPNLEAGSQQPLKRAAHLIGELTKPAFNVCVNHDLLQQGHNFAVLALHLRDCRVLGRKADRVDSSKELLEMGLRRCEATKKPSQVYHLNHLGVRGLAQNLQQIVIANEVEAWKDSSFLFQELIERLLTACQLIGKLVELRAHSRTGSKRNHTIVSHDIGKNATEIIIDHFEASLLLWQRPASKDGLLHDKIIEDRKTPACPTK